MRKSTLVSKNHSLILIKVFQWKKFVDKKHISQLESKIEYQEYIIYTFGINEPSTKWEYLVDISY